MSTMPEFDCRKYLRLMKTRKTLLLVLSLAIVTVFVVISFLLPKIYLARSAVYIEKKLITELLKGIAVTPSAEESVKGLGYAMTSRNVLLKVIDDLHLNKNKTEEQLENLIASIQRNVNLVVKDKNIFFISYKNEDPVLARDLLNSMITHYIAENVTLKKEDTREATKFLSDQMAAVQQKLEEAEKDVNEYKSTQGGLIAIDEKELFQQINEAQQKLYDLQLRRRHLEGLRPVAKRAGDPMQVRLMSLQKRLEELRTRYTENYPEVIQVKSEMDSLREEMKNPPSRAPQVDHQELERAEAEIAAIRMTENGLKRHIKTNQALLQQIPTARGGLEKLELERGRKKALYDQLLARHGQSEFTKQMEVQDQTPTFKVVEPAILPTKPISPNRVKIIVMGIIFGLAGAAGLLLVLDKLDRSVKSLDTLKSLGVPVLALIPKIQDPVQIEAGRRRDRRLYVMSAAYFSVILIVLVLEMARPSLIDLLF